MSEQKYKRMTPKLAEKIDLILSEASMTLTNMGYYDTELDKVVYAHEFEDVYGWNPDDVLYYIQKKLGVPTWAYNRALEGTR